jgi:hypothetical protein
MEVLNNTGLEGDRDLKGEGSQLSSSYLDILKNEGLSVLHQIFITGN